MKKIETGGSAFPCMPPQDTSAGCAVGYPFPDSGMTLRDYFAAKALQGLLASEVCAEEEVFAARSYSMADAMLKARGQ